MTANSPEEKKESDFKEERIRSITQLYYSRPDIQKAILTFSKDRELIPRYFEGFGKRPDTLQYESDILELVKRGATSFHSSQELWHDPLQISTSMKEAEFNALRKGWDLLLDIDSKYLDYSKIAAKALLEALSFHGIKNFGIKFSGSKGFHIIIPSKAFPKEVFNSKTSNMFPEWPRIITTYLTELIKPKLIDEITNLTITNKYVKDFSVSEKVMPDLILVSPRHLFRTPYSLHEKTALASVVLNQEDIKDFQPNNADPLKVRVRSFLPENAEQDEARELLMQALDWYRENRVFQEDKSDSPSNKNSSGTFREVNIDRSKMAYAPVIEQILKGVEDGRKRALFVLLNYFRCLNFDLGEIEKLVGEWNSKNQVPLKEGYIKAQIDWQKRQKGKILPPNYDKDYYKGIGVIPTEEELRYKNPVNYTVKKSFQQNSQEKTKKKTVKNTKDK